MLPGKARCLLRLEFGSWLRPRAVSRLRARDKIIKSLRSELLLLLLLFSCRILIGSKFKCGVTLLSSSVTLLWTVLVLIN